MNQHSTYTSNRDLKAQIFALNNRAVDHLRQQEPDHAVALLRVALEMAQAELSKCVASQGPEQQQQGLRSNHALAPECSSGSPNPASRVAQVSVATTRAVDIQRSLMPESGMNLISFYERAFRLEAPEDVLGPEEEVSPVTEQYDAVFAIIIYNIGMAHCLTASTTMHQSSQAFGMALNMFQLALSIVTKTTGPFEKHHRLVLLALLNNIGYLHSQFVRVRELTQCLAFMKDVLNNFMSVRVVGQEGGTRDDELRFFLNQTLQENPNELVIAAPMA